LLSLVNILRFLYSQTDKLNEGKPVALVEPKLVLGNP